MEMKRLSSGNLRAVGYDERTRTLRVELSGGNVVEYSPVPADAHRRLVGASSPWSYFRDNIEDEYTARRVK